jgi:kynureninase
MKNEVSRESERAAAIAQHYSRFRVSERLLLTGHSHQAWPDIAEKGLLESFRDAALHVDDKWGRAMEKTERVRNALRVRLQDPDGEYAFAQSTHDLLLRFLSGLPLRERPRLVTTDSEFHSMRRQFKRLEEEGLEVVWVPSEPMNTLPERMAAEIDERVAAVLVSLVFFNSGRIARGIESLVEPCAKAGAAFLVDTYHATGVLDFSVQELGLESAFMVGGGYKYLQWGEGNCFLRFPSSCDMRPSVTGWFADFAGLDKPQDGGPVPYHSGPARFAGATYDPVSHYRAAAVADFFDEQGLTAPVLRDINQHQLGVLAKAFDQLDLPEDVIWRQRDVPLSETSGFLTLRSPRASELRQALSARGVLTDSRGDRLRFGPAPYLMDGQLEEAMNRLKKCVHHT